MSRPKRDLERTTVFLPPSDVQELRDLAERKGEPVASLIRRAVEQYLAKARKSSKPVELRNPV
jgi:hypothetical protein